MAPPSATSDADAAGPGPGPDAGITLSQVVTEISAEAAARRAAGDFTEAEERALDRAFEEESPVSSHQALAEALRQVDEASYVDPVAPVASNRPGGAGLKKGIRAMSLWYVGWVIRQVNQFAVATSRSLHIIERRLNDFDQQLQELQHADRAVAVVEFPDLHHPGAWWVPSAQLAVEGAPGPAWLVTAGPADWWDGAATVSGDVMFTRLQASAPGQLGALVLAGVVDGMDAPQRDRLLELVGHALGDSGILVVHSVTAATWLRDDAPTAADLAPGRPLRSGSWRQLLSQDGYEVSIQAGPEGADYLVVAQRRLP